MSAGSGSVLTFNPTTLPVAWREATLSSLLGDNGVFVDGDWVESKDQDPAGDVRLIQLADVGDGGYRDRSARFLTSEKARELSCTFLEPGDVLIARMPDPLGRACIFPGDKKRAVTVVDVAVIRPQNAEVNARWLMYCVNAPQFRRAVTSLQSGSTRQRISRSNLARIRFPLPPRPVQDKLVAEIEKQLSRLDEAVANLKRVKGNLKRYRAAVLKAAVEGRLVPAEADLARREGRTYETGEQLLARILTERRTAWENHAAVVRKKEYMDQQPSDNLAPPELSDGWAWASIGLLGDVIGGLTKNPKRARLKTRLPYLRVANVYANELRLGEMEYIGVHDKELDKLLVRKGDLLIVEGNGSQDQIGRVAIWDGSINPCVHQNHLIKVRLLGGCLPGWVLLWLLSPAGRNLVTDIASSTSGLYTLSVGKVAALSVPLPSLPEQRRIVAEVDRRLSMADEMETQADVSLQRAERLRQAILKQAFEGRLG